MKERMRERGNTNGKFAMFHHLKCIIFTFSMMLDRLSEMRGPNRTSE